MFNFNNKYASSSKLKLTRLDNLNSYPYEDTIVTEFSLDLFINGKHENTFLCSPLKFEELVVGYLSSKNLIHCKEDISLFKLSPNYKVANVEINKINNLNQKTVTQINKYDSIKATPIPNNNIKITASEIYDTMNINLNYSNLFKDTAGVHCVSIYEKGNLIVSCEDVARHNALDKAIGYCILNDISLNDKIVFISGRISFEMIKKAAAVQIPIVIGKSATTSLVIETANKLNITLVGFVRDNKMNIYTNPSRIILK